MKILSAMLAAAMATAALGLPAAASAQTMQGPVAYHLVSADPMHHGDMRPGNKPRRHMRRDRMHGHNMGHHHNWQRHCWTKWRHHHRVRVCH